MTSIDNHIQHLQPQKNIQCKVFNQQPLLVIIMKRAILAISILLAANTHSETVNPEVLSNLTVSRTHVNTNYGYFFKTTQTMENPHNCSSNAWYRLNPDGSHTKEAFSLLLAAHMSGKKVQLSLNGCDSTYPKVDWINIHD